MPKISIVLTSFNHAEYIAESIESILNQTYGDFELIIWDDASADNSWEIIQSYNDSRIRSFRNDVRKIGTYGVNKAISEVANGEYIAIHHSDDVWEIDRLEKQVPFLDSDDKLGAVFSRAQIIDGQGNPFTDESHFYYNIFNQPNRSRFEWLRFFFDNGNALCHPSVLIRKRAYADCGTYRYGLSQLPDFDMWIRLTLKYEILVLSDKLVRFRFRGDEINTSGSNIENQLRFAFEYSLILENFLQISSVDELLSVFPEARKYCNGENPQIQYALAMAMLELQPFPSTIQFALNTLFKIINTPQSKSSLHFDDREYTKLTGKYDPLRLKFIAEKDSQISNLIGTLNLRDSQIAALSTELGEVRLALFEVTGRYNAVINSNSWRVLEPLRSIKSKLTGSSL